MTDYVLADDGKTPIRVPSILRDPQAWAAAMHNSHERYDWIVAKTEIGDTDNSRVSTVFLFSDHGYPPVDGPKPILWETMVFSDDPEWDCACERYTSRRAAEAGHEDMVQQVRDAKLGVVS